MAARVLIVDSISANRILLKVKLTGAFSDVEQAASAGEALDLLEKEVPDMLVLGGDLVDMSAVDLCSLVKENPRLSHMPVLLLHTEGTRADRIEALRAGADDAFEIAVSTDAFLARIRSIVRIRNSYEELRLRERAGRIPGLAEAMSGFETSPNVLLATRSAREGQQWQALLSPLAPYRLRHQTLEDVMRNVGQFAEPDAIVISLAVAAPEEALRLLAEVRARAATRQAAVLVILDETNDTARINALDLGANDVIVDGFHPEEAMLRLDSMIARKRLTDRLRKRVEDGLTAAVTDPLTGLFNRRYAMPHLTKMAQRVQGRSDRRGDFAVMLADLDHFKEVNDTYGHAAGDIVLAEIARRMRGNLKQADLIARMGGEEFLIVVQTDDRESATKVAQRLCDVVRNEPVYLRGRDLRIPVTVSIGVAMGSDLLSAKQLDGKPSHDPVGNGLASALIDRADQALYGAKADGRDKVTLSCSAA